MAMAINNVSGNFQPPTTANGKALPDAVADAPAVNASAVDDAKVTPLRREPPVHLQQSEVRQVSEAIREDAAFTQNIARRLQFQVDEEVGVTVIKVYDRETDELIRQFPPEELLNLSKRLKALNEEQSKPTGILLQEKV